jgi:hypothetical protein
LTDESTGVVPKPFAIAHLEEAVQRMLAVQSVAQA